jgi:hypothetical protein
MRYEPGQEEAWLAWFMSPGTTDAQQLQLALQSVPQRFAHWLFVERRLRVELYRAHDALLPPMAARPPYRDRYLSAEELQQLTVVDSKERCFHDEVVHRRPGGARDSMGPDRR